MPSFETSAYFWKIFWKRHEGILIVWGKNCVRIAIVCFGLLKGWKKGQIDKWILINCINHLKCNVGFLWPSICVKEFPTAKKKKKIVTKNKRDSNYVRVHFPTFSHATNYDATLPIQLDVWTHNFRKLHQITLLIHFFSPRI